MLNANKEGITLNLKSAEGCDLLRQLVMKADVLVENFSPGTMARHGVGSDVLRGLNPRLIYAAGTGFGATGPHRDFLAMDITVQAMTGIMAITGEGDGPPLKAGPALCDFLGGVHLFGAITMALYARERTGVGATVDVSMQDSVFPTLATAIGALHFLGHHPTRTGNRHSALSLAPYNVYRTADGHVAIICIREGHWRNLTAAMGRTDLLADARFADMTARARNMAEVDAAVESWTSVHTKADIFAMCQAHDVICAPVQDLEEVLADPHMHDRGALQRVTDPVLGETVLPSTPLRLAGLTPPARVPSPALGQDNARIYRDLLGLDPARIAALHAAGAI
jgi:crotonobetainyl-CoA:carnitine CoA-transferase CaiB-like acyl-CoA transferase